MPRLLDCIRPCGPTIDAAAADRLLEDLRSAADTHGWQEALRQAWPALRPIFSAAPYLAFLARIDPSRLRRAIEDDADQYRAALIDQASRLGDDEDRQIADQSLRRLKMDAHLLIGIADLGGAWSLRQVAEALSDFADACLDAAFRQAARGARRDADLSEPAGDADAVTSGIFCIAMGKYGARELNYSSDIDISIFYDEPRATLSRAAEAQKIAVRFAERLFEIIHRRTSDGYVFRVDYRLRPDPSSTPIAVSTRAALEYYETRGQNWERAAYIKARPVAGDILAANRFLTDLQPFVWRRNLDFATIADIHSIKRQIRIHKADNDLEAPGADLKLGPGGIREVEFFVQTQQLILGGRYPDLRARGTLAALSALVEGGLVAAEVGQELADGYASLRRLEHRVQMVGDEQTHRLPTADGERRRVAFLAGFDTLRAFDADVRRTLKTVHHRFGELFAGEEALSSRFGSLVFTGVDDDRETLATLARMGFQQGRRVSSAIRAWHRGEIPATRGAGARELLTRLTPRLLEAARSTRAPDAAFWGFHRFFGGLSSGVQIQSLFLARPRLLALVLRIMAFAPRIARTLSRQPAALDVLLDPVDRPDFGGRGDTREAIGAAGSLEGAMDVARRLRRECAFGIAASMIRGDVAAASAGKAFSELADTIIAGLSAAALAAITEQAGAFAGDVAVIALGKGGSREMTAASDLDLMTLYHADQAQGVSAKTGWPSETYFARFTQRLVAALSVPTAEGELYQVDLRLRPSGAKGPVAVSLAAFESYYRASAETWELLALTRARVVWATSQEFSDKADAAIEQALRRPRDASSVARDVLAMRQLMRRERPARGLWDMKLIDGGLVDIEFAAQHLQLIHAGRGGPLPGNTAEALTAFAALELAPASDLGRLAEAWSLQQALSQLIKVALEDGADPDSEEAGFQLLLARAGGTRSMKGLRRKLIRVRAQAHAAFEAIVSPR